MLLRSFVALLATGAAVQAVPSADEAKTDKGFEVVIVYAKPEGGCNTPPTACKHTPDNTSAKVNLAESIAVEGSDKEDKATPTAESHEPPKSTINYTAPTTTMKPAVHWDTDIKPAANVKPVAAEKGNKLYYGVTGKYGQNTPGHLTNTGKDPKEAGSFAFLTYYFNQPSVNLDQCGQVSHVAYNDKDLTVSFASDEAYEIALETWSADDQIILITFTEGCGDFDKEDRCYFKVSGLTHDDKKRTIVASGTPTHPDDLISMGESEWGYWTPDDVGEPVVSADPSFTWDSTMAPPTPTPNAGESRRSFLDSFDASDPSSLLERRFWGKLIDKVKDVGDKIKETGKKVVDEVEEKVDEVKKVADEVMTLDKSMSKEFSYKIPDPDRRVDSLVMKVAYKKSPWGLALRLWEFDGREEKVGKDKKGKKNDGKPDAPKPVKEGDDNQSDSKRPQELDRFIRLYCVDCAVSGTTKVGGRLKWVPSEGIKEGKLEMWNDMQLKLFLGIDAQYAFTQEYTQPIAAVGLPGLSYGVITIGPYISLDAKFSFQAAASGRLLAGAEMTLQDAHISLDLVHDDKVSAENWRPEVKPKLEVEGELKLSAAFGLPVGIKCGVKVAKWEVSVGLVNEPSINAIAQVAASIGNINGTKNWDSGIKEKNGCNGISTQLSWRNSLYVDMPKKDPMRLLDTALNPLAQGCIDLPHRQPIRRSRSRRFQYRDVTVGDGHVPRSTIPDSDAIQKPLRKIPHTSFEDSAGRKFSTIFTSSMKDFIAGCSNGNVEVFSRKQTNIPGCSATWSITNNVLVGDSLNRAMYYEIDTMSRLGVSRLQLKNETKVPETGRVVAFVPSDKTQNYAYVAVDASDAAFYPMACDHANGSTKVFLVDDLGKVQEMLKSEDLRDSMTGGDIEACHLLHLKQSSLTTQGYSTYKRV